jgi:hypothetical protein
VKALAVIVIVAALLAACVNLGDAGPTVTAVPSTLPAPSPSPSPFPADDAFARQVIEFAAPSDPGTGAIDQLWQRIWADEQLVPGRPYVPLDSVVAYRGGSEVPTTPCATATTLRFWTANARYCSLDSSVYFDEGWVRDLAAGTSDVATDTHGFAAGAILAHEWGHHIQDLVGFHGHQIDAELQADCFAGMFLGSRQKVELNAFNLDDSDLIAGLTTIFEIGNKRYSASDWTSPVEHGSSRERMMAYGTGWLGTSGDVNDAGGLGHLGSLADGYAWCQGYGAFAASSYSMVGPYRLINIPGRAVSVSANGLTVSAALDVHAPTSEVRALWLPELIEPEPEASTDATISVIARAINALLPQSTALAPPIAIGTGAGVGWSVYVERHPTPDSVESGVIFVLYPKTGTGVLAIAAMRPITALPQTIDKEGYKVLFEHLSSVSQFANRLCGPGEAADADPPFGQVACADDQ